MASEKIHLVTQINGKTLIVFWTALRCWQFRIINADGEVFGTEDIYYLPEAAERAGRELVERQCDRSGRSSTQIISLSNNLSLETIFLW
ncbi:MAG: hypothetical protein F6K36_23040 [Symploca sp. SIO3C6]|nr:hypothetical protein [Symploca sp. SIO3C6]NET08390.1 hypothetical protein [Symploca sp. SIO2B6]NET47820.1 hypothetical protein [Merismopedia sp. SIO2A8]